MTRSLPYVAPAAVLVVLFLFQSLFVKRVSQATQARCLLAYPISQMDLDYQYYVSQPERAAEQRTIQSKTDAGETILAWTALPYLLDYSRNRILTASEPGLMNPWLALPAGADAGTFLAYLRRMNVRYVMLEVRGFAVKDVANLKRLLQADHSVYRKLADYGIYMRETLQQLARSSRIIHVDGTVLLYDLEGIPSDMTDFSSSSTGG